MKGESELIAALRAENHRLTVENAELSSLRTIIDAQDKLLVAADARIRQLESGCLNALEAVTRAQQASANSRSI